MTKRYFEEAPQKRTAHDEQKTDTGILSSLLKNFKSDDLILIGIILFLLQSDEKDKELLTILALLLVSG